MKIKVVVFSAVILFFVGEIDKPLLAKSNIFLVQKKEKNKQISKLELIPNIADNNKKIKGFEIIGNTVFSTPELERLLNDYLVKELPFEEIRIEIRAIITQHYIEKGYVASFATISQGEKPGFIRINIVEGRINRLNIVQIKGYLKKSRVKSLLEKNILGDVYNNKITARKIANLTIIDDDIKSIAFTVDADFDQPGKVTLNLVVEITPALTLSAITANTGSPAFGEISNSLLLNTRIIGVGDRLNVIGLFSEANSGVILGYSIPINAKNIKVFGNYSSDGGEIAESPFSFANINLRSESYRLGLEIPLIEDPIVRLKLGLIGRVEQSVGELEGIGAPLVRGSDDQGNLRVTTLRLPISYLRRNKGDTFEWEFSLNSEFVLGLNFFDATTNDRGFPDSRFILVNNELKYIKVLDRNTETFFQVQGILQLAANSLPAFEAGSLGGFGTVRGFRQGILFNDNIAFLSGEFSTSIFKNENISLASVIFVDFGKGWDSNSFVSNSNSLLSRTQIVFCLWELV